MTTPVPCLGSCGATLRRSTGMAVCTPCTRRVDDVIALLPLPEGYADPRLARANLVWGSELIVTALAKLHRDDEAHALEQWQAIREEQQAHRRACRRCTPDMAVCEAGQHFAELERAGWRLLHRARAAEGSATR